MYDIEKSIFVAFKRLKYNISLDNIAVDGGEAEGGNYRGEEKSRKLGTGLQVSWK